STPTAQPPPPARCRPRSTVVDDHVDAARRPDSDLRPAAGCLGAPAQPHGVPVVHPWRSVGAPWVLGRHRPGNTYGTGRDAVAPSTALNPRVRGSSPWRRTLPEQAV